MTFQAIGAVLCRLRGHSWVARPNDAPLFYTCKRCGEPGFEVPR